VSRLRSLLFLFLFGFGLSSIHAVEHRPSTGELSDFEYARGTRAFEMLGGGFTSFNKATRKRPQFDFALASVRLGWMLTDARTGLFFGNEEFLIEGFGGPILKGSGDGMAGATLILRHNFARRSGSFFVPYFQMGAGGLYSDAADDDPVQFGIGTTFEFNLQAALGARWRVNSAWSINTEVGYRHISNAGLDSRNGGVDSIGGFIGFGRTF
jgi:opacity protein-like surface antigen